MTKLLVQSNSYESSVIQQITSIFNNLMAVMNAFPSLCVNAVFIKKFHGLEKLEAELQICLVNNNATVKLNMDGINTFPAMIRAFDFRF
jgi:hypothetical protein